MARVSTTIGSSGTSATAQARDARRNAYLAEMGGGTITTNTSRVGSSGTSATAQARDARRDTYLAEMGSQTTQNTPQISISQSSAPKSSTPSTQTAASTPTKSTGSSGRTTGSSGRTTGTGSLPKGMSAVSTPTTTQRLTDRDAYDTGVRSRYAERSQSTGNGYAPTYGPTALYTNTGNLSINHYISGTANNNQDTKQLAKNSPGTSSTAHSDVLSESVVQTAQQENPHTKISVADTVATMQISLSALTDSIQQLEKEKELLLTQNQNVLDYANTFRGSGSMQHAMDIMRQVYDIQSQIDEKKGKADALSDQLKQAQLYSWASMAGNDDFSKYATAGANIKNPSFEEVEGTFSSVNNKEDKIGNIVTYSRDNAHTISMYESQNGGYAGDYRYQYLTDDEVQLYNYLLGRYDKETARIYLDTLEEAMNARAGHNLAEMITQIENPTLRALAAVPFGFGAGVDQFVSGIKQLGSEKELPISVTQFASQDIRQSLGTGGQIAYDVSGAVGNMLPSILISKGIGALSSTLGASASVAGKVAAGVGATAMGASSAGNAYSQALHEGFSPEQAKTYAACIGASEAALQYVLGGIGALNGVTDDVLLAKAKAFDSTLAKMVAAGAIKVGGEVVEEELQLQLEPVFRSLILGDTYQAPSGKDMLQTAIIAGLSTGVVEGPAIAGIEIDYGAYGELVLQEQSAYEVIETAMKDNLPDTLPGQLAQELAGQMEDGESPSTESFGKLYAVTQANEQSGQAVKAEGKTAELLQDGLAMPEGTQAHQLAEQLSEQLETALTEMGLDASELYHMSRADQTALIGQVTNKTLSDQSVGELARLVEGEHLTGGQKHDKVDTQTYLSTEVYPQALADGHISIDTVRRFAKALETADIESMSRHLERIGYATKITESVRQESKAQIIRITGGNSIQNISQVQFSPGGGRHGPNPYLKFSTIDQGIIKIVFGDPSTYVSSGNEKATIIFAEEMNEYV